jgi:hypothetical protein
MTVRRPTATSGTTNSRAGGSGCKSHSGLLVEQARQQLLEQLPPKPVRRHVEWTGSLHSLSRGKPCGAHAATLEGRAGCQTRKRKARPGRQQARVIAADRVARPSDRAKSEPLRETLRPDVVRTGIVKEVAARRAQQVCPRGDDGRSAAPAAKIRMRPHATLGRAFREADGRVADRCDDSVLDCHGPRTQVPGEQMTPLDGLPVSGLAFGKRAAVHTSERSMRIARSRGGGGIRSVSWSWPKCSSACTSCRCHKDTGDCAPDLGVRGVLIRAATMGLRGRPGPAFGPPARVVASRSRCS